MGREHLFKPNLMLGFSKVMFQHHLSWIWKTMSDLVFCLLCKKKPLAFENLTLPERTPEKDLARNKCSAAKSLNFLYSGNYLSKNLLFTKKK